MGGLACAACQTWGEGINGAVMQLPIRNAFRAAFAISILVGRAWADPPLGATSIPNGRALEHRAILPADFIENQGQWNTTARFTAWSGAMNVGLKPDRIELDRVDGTQVALVFEGASNRVAMIGEAERGTCYNFFIGSEPALWRSQVPAYAAILYRGLYDGVDVRIREEAEQLEYDLLLAPGADLSQVIVRAEASSALTLDSDGALILETAAGPLRQPPPKTWQVERDGTKRPVECRFHKVSSERYGFEVPKRDSALALVIDPGLEWSTFLGGWNREEIHGVAMARDGSGDVVVAGHTFSTDFPTAPPGALGTSPLISFVARLNSSGTGLIYATLFGGTHGNVSYGYGLTLDASSTGCGRRDQRGRFSDYAGGIPAPFQ
jgi:hypothetical protein